VKFLLPALLIGASTAYAGVKTTFTLPHYLLLYPKATLETDAGGHCTRLINLSDGIVYVPLTDEPPTEVAKALPGLLIVQDCTRR
jgi:hypothetical protein